MRVLHITYWFPNPSNTKDALWIQKQIESIDTLAEQKIVHLQIKPFDRFSVVNKRTSKLRQIIVSLPTKSWAIIEMISSLTLFILLLSKRVNKRFDIINFHIAYPNLTYWHLVKKLVKIPIVITEHWSAYHFNFNVKKRLPRIQHIFQQKIPTIAVSHSLLNDIHNFSESEFQGYIVPNITDEVFFYPNSTIERENLFFMLSQWKWPKKPLVVFKAFKQFILDHPKFRLVVGGYGPDYPQIERWVIENKMRENIKLVGSLDPNQVADYFRRCAAFLHSSDYETFSVVCAEAVSCHTPVIASNVGGIPEVVKMNEGILLDSFNIADWRNAMEDSLTKKFVFENSNRFSKKSIGKRYYDLLKRCMNDFKR